MKKGKLIPFPAQPAAEDRNILWAIMVSSAYEREELLIRFADDAKFPVWVIKIRSRTFDAVAAMQEQARRRLGLQATASVYNVQQLREEAQV